MQRLQIAYKSCQQLHKDVKNQYCYCIRMVVRSRWRPRDPDRARFYSAHPVNAQHYFCMSTKQTTLSFYKYDFVLWNFFFRGCYECWDSAAASCDSLSAHFQWGRIVNASCNLHPRIDVLESYILFYSST